MGWFKKIVREVKRPFRKPKPPAPPPPPAAAVTLSDAKTEDVKEEKDTESTRKKTRQKGKEGLVVTRKKGQGINI